MKYAVLTFAAILVLSSCEAPGRRAAQEKVIRPSEIADFDVLYSQNCSGCHGKNGQGALTIGIGRPEYLSIADDAAIRHTIEDGRAGTPMPGFAQKSGGMLTDPQIDILVHGIRSWAKPDAIQGIPAYAALQPGDAARGHDVFKAACAGCHGVDEHDARTIADPSYLALVTDQHLRTVIIVGMPNLGMPDWRGHKPPLAEADITNVVAWLATQRKPLSAQFSH
jgi:cytochrome c oxidase cbb3-type subunit 3